MQVISVLNQIQVFVSTQKKVYNINSVCAVQQPAVLPYNNKCLQSKNSY